jgi:Xaa-Pro aminopeptidase
MNTLVQEKVNQAIGILQELEVDLWMTFVRETSAGGDPVLPLIYGEAGLTWQSALILTQSGERIAIVGHFEAESARSVGAYSQVIAYHEALRPDLLEILERLAPQQIAINYSANDVYADGLSHGLYRVLQGYLEGTPFAQRLFSAEGIIAALRGRKTPAEVARIRRAIQTTEEIYGRTFDYVQVGMTERQISDYMHGLLDDYGVQAAWHYEGCPIVNAGPDSPVGHVAPGELEVARGHLLHFDFGVKQDGYCSDIQRMVYFLAPGESQAPEPVQRAFNTVLRAVQEAVKVMRPGRLGKEVDAVARAIVVEAGYPEYMHATGHHLGREAHDGAGLLGPEWERYGNTPNLPLEAGHVYTVELGVMVPEYGYVGLEEDVLVTERGAEYLSVPQTDLILR